AAAAGRGSDRAATAARPRLGGDPRRLRTGADENGSRLMTTRTAPVHIAGTGSALPGEPVDNASLSGIFGISEEWIDLFGGTRSRHFGWDPGSGKVTHPLADLCAESAGRALDAARLDAVDLDFVVLSTATPDTLLPTTAAETADRLGLNHLPVYQVQAGC